MLARSDYLAAAAKLGCNVAAIRAVAEVEAPRGGFLASGEPTILFEAHIFSRLTGGRFDAEFPSLSSPRWNRKLYGPAGAHQHNRLARAATLDRAAALQSASWGRFQIMGFNYARAGHETLQSFINAMYRDEQAHLDAFAEIILSMGLDDELRRQDWAGFARVYNGPGFAANNYDTKMAAAYQRHAAET